MIDARRRFLRPNGILIPRQDVLMAAPVESPETYDGFVAGFRDGAPGLDLELQRQMALNSWTTLQATDTRFLAEPSRWCELDYRTIESPHAKGRVEWTTAAPASLTV